MKSIVNTYSGDKAKDAYMECAVEFIMDGVQLKISEWLSDKAKDKHLEGADVSYLYTRPDGVSSADMSELIKWIVHKHFDLMLETGRPLSLKAVLDDIEKCDVEILYN